MPTKKKKQKKKMRDKLFYTRENFFYMPKFFYIHKKNFDLDRFGKKNSI